MKPARTLKAAEFKARCLELMDEVARTGETVVVTKRGKPVAELRPVVAKPATLRGFMRGEVEILGDIVAPIDVPWELDG